ncbi:CHASE2 domain-containing protein [Thiolapillus sp.]
MKIFFDWVAEKPVALLILVVLLALLIDFSGVTWRLEQMVADTGISLLPQEAPQNVVIVAVDEKSLRKFGRWPWSRRIHAQLLDQLAVAGTGPVVFDVLFAEVSKADAVGDQLFAAAIARHGKVVLAMASDEDPKDGKVSEVLPLPMFADSAASIGHADMAIDKDGIVRSTYLLAGTAVARWPGLALAAMHVAARSGAADLPGENFSDRKSIHEGRWIRDRRILFPYAGGAGTFPTLSFVDVVEGRGGAEALLGKTVFVGITAAAMRRVFATPDANEGVMSGVEIQANILNSLQQNLAITSAQGLPRQVGLIFLSLVAASILVYARFIGIFSRLLLVLMVSAGLLLAVMMTTGLLLPVVPVWAGLGIVGFLLSRKRIDSLQRSSALDPLTGLYNRRAFESHFENMWRLNERHKQLLFLLIIDVDHFKRFNDALGHLQGDKALKKLAGYLESKTRRAGDRVCRVGGERFAMLLDMDEPDLQHVEAYAQEIVDGIHDLGIHYWDGDTQQQLTVSIGCAGIVPSQYHTREELFDLADRALYQAKNAGRNRIHYRWSEKRSGAVKGFLAAPDS